MATESMNFSEFVSETAKSYLKNHFNITNIETLNQYSTCLSNYYFTNISKDPPFTQMVKSQYNIPQHFSLYFLEKKLKRNKKLFKNTRDHTYYQVIPCFKETHQISAKFGTIYCPDHPDAYTEINIAKVIDPLRFENHIKSQCAKILIRNFADFVHYNTYSLHCEIIQKINNYKDQKLTYRKKLLAKDLIVPSTWNYCKRVHSIFTKEIEKEIKKTNSRFAVTYLAVLPFSNFIGIVKTSPYLEAYTTAVHIVLSLNWYTSVYKKKLPLIIDKSIILNNLKKLSNNKYLVLTATQKNKQVRPTLGILEKGVKNWILTFPSPTDYKEYNTKTDWLTLEKIYSEIK